MSAEAPPGPEQPARPFQKGYKPTPEQLQKMREGRERAQAEKKAQPAAEFTVGAAKVKPKQGKAPKSPASFVDKEVIRDALQMANVALDLTGAGYRVPLGAMINGVPHPLAGRSIYALEPAEIEELTDAWWRVAREYPVFGRFLVTGRKFSVWGNALFVSYVIVGKRISIYDELNRQKKANGPPSVSVAAPPPSEQPIDIPPTN